MAVRSGLQSYTFLLSVNLHFTLCGSYPVNRPRIPLKLCGIPEPGKKCRLSREGFLAMIRLQP